MEQCTTLEPALGMWGTATDMAKLLATFLNNGTFSPTGAQVCSKGLNHLAHSRQILEAQSVLDMETQHYQSSDKMPGVYLRVCVSADFLIDWLRLVTVVLKWNNVY